MIVWRPWQLSRRNWPCRVGVGGEGEKDFVFCFCIFICGRGNKTRFYDREEECNHTHARLTKSDLKRKHED